MSMIFYSAVSVFSIPLTALGCEMTDDHHERTSIFAYGSFIGNTFALVTPWIYQFANHSSFENEVEGMKVMGYGIAVLIAFSTLICFFFCKERSPEKKESNNKDQFKFWPSMKATFQNKAFKKLILSVFVVAVGFNFVNGFNNYIMIYYLFDGDKQLAAQWMGFNGTTWAITALIAVFPMSWCSQTFGKAKAVQAFILILALGSFAKVYCYNPNHPWLTH